MFTKLQSICPEKYFEKKINSDKISFLYNYFRFSSKTVSDFCPKVPTGLSKMCSTCESNIFRKFFYKIYSRLWAKTFRTFGKSFFGSVVRTVFYLSRVMLWDNINLLKNFFILIITSDFEQKKIQTLAKGFCRGCQNFILRVKKNPSGKNMFRKFFLISWIVP